ncbi:MAG: ATP-binding protein [Methanomassiliicoccus sp.]|nr:ATP-binding protein [Methanomassiliicoccus sp.]
MLIEFSVTNFRSIKNEVHFSMLASTDDTLNENTIANQVDSKHRLLRIAAIYGPNASGKTNILLAFDNLRRLVLSSHSFQKGTKMGYFPFMLDQNWIGKPTKYEVAFIKNNVRYQYGLEYNNEKVISEYLYYFPNGKKSIIFERNLNGKIWLFNVDKKEQELCSKQTLENTLYLSRSSQLNYSKTGEALSWFMENVGMLLPSIQTDLEEWTARMLLADPETKKKILLGLAEADLGIVDATTIIKKYKDIENEHQAPLPNELKQLMGLDKNPNLEFLTIRTAHRGIDKKGQPTTVPFDFQSGESEGTKRMFSLIGPWIDALKTGRMIFIDELDVKLHPSLIKFLLKMFNDPEQNQKGAQLIFTTHNTGLLDQDIFRRDQIWFTQRNHKLGDTELYSLIEFGPRKDANIEKGYLAGRYGALPFIKGKKVI